MGRRVTQLNSQSAERRGSLVRRTAIFAAVVALGSIYAANTLSRMVQNGRLAYLAGIWSEIELRRLASAAPPPQGRRVTVVRSIDVDGVRTATIPHDSKAIPRFSRQAGEAR